REVTTTGQDLGDPGAAVHAGERDHLGRLAVGVACAIGLGTVLVGHGRGELLRSRFGRDGGGRGGDEAEAQQDQGRAKSKVHGLLHYWQRSLCATAGQYMPPWNERRSAAIRSAQPA